MRPRTKAYVKRLILIVLEKKQDLMSGRDIAMSLKYSHEQNLGNSSIGIQRVIQYCLELSDEGKVERIPPERRGVPPQWKLKP